MDKGFLIDIIQKAGERGNVPDRAIADLDLMARR
jgi:hypothetical protein